MMSSGSEQVSGGEGVRRPGRVLPVILTVAMLLMISACSGSGGSEPDASTSPNGRLPAAEGSTSYPLTLTTWAGTSQLAQRPERIAVIGFSTNLDFLEALDAVPTYALTDDGDWEWRQQDFVRRIEYVDPGTRRDPVNLEAIAASRPDLIVALNSLADRAVFDQLSAIAPVLDYRQQLGDQADWLEGQRLVGQALDLAQAAEEAIGAVDRQFAELADQHPEFAGRTVTVATDYETTGLQYYSVAGGTAERFLGELGFAANPLARRFVDTPTVSEELLGQLDADVLIVNYFTNAAREQREASRLFQAVPAVRDGRYVAVVTEEPDAGGNVVWVLRRGASTLSVPWAARVVAESWLADVDLAR